MSGATDRPLVEVDDLVVEYAAPAIGRGRGVVRAVAGVSLSIGTGETYGLVGESGSGKTTLGRAILRLLRPTAGRIVFDGTDITSLSGESMRRIRRDMQVVFQSPVASLDPRSSVLDAVAEPLRTHASMSRREREASVLALLEEVGLASIHLGRYPHELSGGQCQRVALARALALRPKLLVLDEPTSALDVSVQAQILNLLAELRQAHGLAFLLISHDLDVVAHLADRIGIMYLGRLVEEGPTAEILAGPAHPYGEALLASAPVIPGADRAARPELILTGDVPSPMAPPPGCRFHPRCPRRAELGDPVDCRTVDPSLVAHGASRAVACHHPLDQPVAVDAQHPGRSLP